MNDKRSLAEKLRAVIDDDAASENEKRVAAEILSRMHNAKEQVVRNIISVIGAMKPKLRCDRCHAAHYRGGGSLFNSRGKYVCTKEPKGEGINSFRPVTGFYYDGQSPDDCYYKILFRLANLRLRGGE
jgi:hypothetical protein